MVHIPKQKRRKWNPKAQKCHMVGFDEGIKGYRVLDPRTKKVLRNRDVTFIKEADVVAQALVVYDNKPMVITLHIKGTVSISPTPDEVILMEQPPLFKDRQNPIWVCRLNKALYGLKQSSSSGSESPVPKMPHHWIKKPMSKRCW